MSGQILRQTRILILLGWRSRRAVCEEITKTMFVIFIKDEEWCKLSEDAKFCANPGFGRKLTLLFERCLLRYDEKLKYFIGRERRRGRVSLTQKLFKHVEPTVSSLLQNLHSEFLAKFKDAFDKAVNEERFPSDADHCTLHWIVDSFRDRCADVMMEGATWDITVSERNFRAEVKAHIMSKLKQRWSRLAFLLPLGLLALPSLLFLVVHLLRWSVLFFSLYHDWLQ